jgi:hypothetical protein
MQILPVKADRDKQIKMTDGGDWYHLVVRQGPALQLKSTT